MRFHNAYSSISSKIPEVSVRVSRVSALRTGHILLATALFFLAVTLFLAGLSFQMKDMALRVQTMLYATYIFITGTATLVVIEVVHLAKKENSRTTTSSARMENDNKPLCTD